MRSSEIRLKEDILHCPICGSNYLHHGAVTIFRRIDDTREGAAIKINADGTIAFSTDLTGNPSLRRGAVSIDFFCEDCGDDPTLSISQHKGNSVLSWESKRWSRGEQV